MKDLERKEIMRELRERLHNLMDDAEQAYYTADALEKGLFDGNPDDLKGAKEILTAYARSTTRDEKVRDCVTRLFYTADEEEPAEA